MIRSIENEGEKGMNRLNDSTLLPIKIVELLAGIRVVDAATAGVDPIEQQPLADPSADKPFYVMFLDLPDDCVNFEDQSMSANSQVKLSVELLERYRTIHKVISFLNDRMII